MRTKFFVSLVVLLLILSLVGCFIGKSNIQPRYQHRYLPKQFGNIYLGMPFAEFEKAKDLGKMEKDVEFKALMEKRKEEYGVDKGVDMVVTPDESIKIADSTIPMQEILDKIRLKEDGLIEKDIMTGRRATPKMDERVDSGNLKERGQASGKDTFENDFADEKSKSIYGIYVVQTGDNIWNIHFEFLRDYFMKKGVTLALVSDEPNILGRSSGVGKLLKFSEKMVYIYNIKERKLDVDLNQIHPLSKIVVLNLGQAFSLLDQIDYKNVNHIEFDGETLWIPAEQE